MDVNVVSTSFKLTIAMSLLMILIAETQSAETYDTYVRNSCNKTLYSAECSESLSPYSANIKSKPGRLCQYAAKVARNATKAANSGAKAVKKTKGLTGGESAAANDCLETTKEAVDLLRQCYEALVEALSLASEERKVKMDDARTWASAAMTNDDTCTDGMEEMGVGPERMGDLKESVVKASRLTSVLLAFMRDDCS